MNFFATAFAGATAAAMMLSGGLAHAQGYPNKFVCFVVTYPPGGSSDVMARIIGRQFGHVHGERSGALGQTHQRSEYPG